MDTNPFAKFVQDPEAEGHGVNPFDKFAAVSETELAEPVEEKGILENLGTLWDRSTTTIAQQGGGVGEMAARQEGISTEGIADALLPPESDNSLLDMITNPMGYTPVLDIATEIGGGLVKEAVDAADQIISGDVRQAMQQTGEMLRSEANAELTAPENQYDAEGIEKYLYEVAEATTGMVVPLATGAVTKSPALAMTILSAQVAGNTYATTMEKTEGDHAKSMGAAKFSIIAEALPEALPVTAALRKTGAGEAISRLIETTLGEGGQEMLTEILTSVYDDTQLENMTFKEALTNIDWNEVGHAGLIGLGVGTAIGTPGSIADAAATLEEYSVAVNQGDFRGQSPEAQAAEIVEAATPGDVAPPAGTSGGPVEVMPDPRDDPNYDPDTAPTLDTADTFSSDMDLELNDAVVADMIAEQEAQVVADAVPLPEPDETINRQIEVMDDPATDRSAVYLPPGAKEPAVDPDTHLVIELGDGGLAIVPATPEGRQTAQELNSIDWDNEATKQATIAKATGIGGEGKTPGATEAVVVTDPDGTVVQSAVADPAGEVLAAAQAVADTREGTVEVTTPEEVLAERVETGDLEAGLDTAPLNDLEAGLDEVVEFKEATTNATGALKEAVAGVGFAFDAHQFERDKQKMGAKPTGSREQLAIADKVWADMAKALPKLTTEGYDTTQLYAILSTAAGGRKVNQDTLNERGGNAISGRKNSGVGKKFTSKQTPAKGWGGVIKDLYAGLDTEMRRMASEGPTIAQEDIIGTDAYKAKKKVEKAAKAKVTRLANKAKLESKMAVPPQADIDLDLDLVEEADVVEPVAPETKAEKAKKVSKKRTKPTPEERQAKMEADSKAFAAERKGGGRGRIVDGKIVPAAVVEEVTKAETDAEVRGTRAFLKGKPTTKAALLAMITSRQKGNERIALNDPSIYSTQQVVDLYNGVTAPETASAVEEEVTQEEKDILAADRMAPGDVVDDGAGESINDEGELSGQEYDDETGEASEESNLNRVEASAVDDITGHVQSTNPKHQKVIDKFEESILNSPEEEAEILMKRQQQEAFDAAVGGAEEVALQAKMDEIRKQLAEQAEANAEANKAAAEKAAASKPVIQTKKKRRIAELTKAAKDGAPAAKRTGKLSIKPRVLKDMAAQHEQAARAEAKALSNFTKNREGISDGREDGAIAMERVLQTEEGVTAETIMDVLSDELHEADPFRVLIDRMRDVGVQDIEVLLVSEQEMAMIAGDNTNGAFVTDANGDSVILIHEGSLLSGFGTKVFMHEMVHAMTAEATRTNNATALKLEALRKRVVAELEAEGGVYAAQDYGFTNVDEFVAEAMTNPEFQRVLASVKVGNDKSLWTKFIDIISSMLGIPVDKRSALAEVLTLSNDLFLSPEQVTKAQEDPARYIREDVELDATNDEIYAMMQGDKSLRVLGHRGVRKFINNVSSQVFGKERKGGTEVVSEGWTTATLGISTMDQIVRNNEKMFRVGRENLLRRYAKIQQEKTHIAREAQRAAEQIDKLWTEYEKTTAGRAATESLGTVMRDSTLDDIHPDVPFWHVSNRHLWRNKKPATLRKNIIRHRDALKRFNKLPPEARGLFVKVKRFYQNQRADMREAVIGQIIKQNKLEIPLTSTDLNALRKAKHPEDLANIDFSKLGELEDGVKESLSTVLHLTDVRGPYFPLRRFGNYAVDAVRETVSDPYTNRKKARAAAQELRASHPLDKIKVKKVDGTYRVVRSERIFETHESKRAADAAAASYNKQGFQARDFTGDVETTLMQIPHQSEGSGIGTVLHHAKGKMDTDSAEYKALETAFTEMLLENSLKKAELRRNKVRGASLDMRRGFAERAFAGSWAVADLKTSFDQSEAISALAKHAKTKAKNKVAAGHVVNELNLRAERDLALRKTHPVDSFLSKAGFVWYLMSPSYTMVNMTQPLLVAEPYFIAKYGPSAAGELVKSYHHIFRLGMTEMVKAGGGWIHGPDNMLKLVLAETEGTPVGDMLEDLTNQGIIDATFMQELYESSQGKDTESMIYKGTDLLMDVARTMPQIAEVINRVVVAKAAYNLEISRLEKHARVKQARREVRGIPVQHDAAVRAKSNHNKATEAAAQAINETQFNYADQNKPRYFKGAIGIKSLMMFKMYSQGMYALMLSNMMKIKRGGTTDGLGSRSARVEGIVMLVGLLTSHTMAAGVLGGALAEPIRMIIYALNKAYGAIEGDDEELDIDAWLEMKFNEMLSPFWAEVASRGIISPMGLDLGSRVSLEDMAMMGLNETRSKADAFVEFIMKSLGPIPAAVHNMYRGADYAASGDYLKGLEAVSPKGVRDLIRGGIRYPMHGPTDYKGAQIPVDLDAFDYFWQGAGFAPSAMARWYDQNSYIKQDNTKHENARKKLIQRWLNSENKIAFEMTHILPFNRRNDLKWEITYDNLNTAEEGIYDREDEKQWGADNMSDREFELRKTLGIGQQ